MRLASFFSGVGGWEAGVTPLGLRPVFACEYDPEIALAYASNWGDHIHVGDVRKLRSADVPRADVVVLSPPCQAFTRSGMAMAAAAAAGKFKQVKDRTLCDPKVGQHAIHLAIAAKPRLICVEEASTYASDARSPLADMIDALAGAGYSVDYRVVDCNRLGVPSDRKRFALVAGRGLDWCPWAVEGEKTAWWPAVEPVLGTCRPAPLAPYQVWHLARRPPPASAFPVLLSGSTSGMNKPKLIWRAHHAPGWAVTTQKSASSMRVLLADGTALSVSVEAAAALMGFPADMRWPGRGRALHMIGNAVPPPFAAAVVAPWVS
jgi:site-specific DNA-cytosine methylase